MAPDVEGSGIGVELRGTQASGKRVVLSSADDRASMIDTAGGRLLRCAETKTQVNEFDTIRIMII